MGVGPLNHLERDALEGFSVFHDIEGIFACFGDFETLHVDDEVSRDEVAAGRYGIFVHAEAEGATWEEFFSVRIDEAYFKMVGAGVLGVENEAKSEGAVRLLYGEFGTSQGVESTENTEFPIIIGGRVADDCSE